jgi:hypothetical protein
MNQRQDNPQSYPSLAGGVRDQLNFAKMPTAADSHVGEQLQNGRY